MVSCMHWLYYIVEHTAYQNGLMYALVILHIGTYNISKWFHVCIGYITYWNIQHIKMYVIACFKDKIEHTSNNNLP